jgi:hypothetical protein
LRGRHESVFEAPNQQPALANRALANRALANRALANDRWLMTKTWVHHPAFAELIVGSLYRSLVCYLSGSDVKIDLIGIF